MPGPGRKKKPLKKYQVALVVLLWLFLVNVVLTSGKVDGMAIFSIVASGIIVFVTLYKNQRNA